MPLDDVAVMFHNLSAVDLLSGLDTAVFTFSGGGDNDKCIEILTKMLPKLNHTAALADRNYKTACQNAQDMPEKNGKTSLPASSLIEKLTQYAKVLEEHYAKVNKENKKFANPSKHIEDKYYNKKSPYYIKGLSDREREICYESEISVLNGGHAAVNSYDPVIQKTFGGGIMHDDEWQQNVRNEMNDSISQLFEENGIVIPDDADSI